MWLNEEQRNGLKISKEQNRASGRSTTVITVETNRKKDHRTLRERKGTSALQNAMQIFAPSYYPLKNTITGKVVLHTKPNVVEEEKDIRSGNGQSLFVMEDASGVVQLKNSKLTILNGGAFTPNSDMRLPMAAHSV